MQFILDQSDFGELSNKARQEIVSLISRRTAPPAVGELDERYRGIAMDGVVDLTTDQVREFAKSASSHTMRGLRAFAENGPVISVVTLNAALEEARVEAGRGLRDGIEPVPVPDHEADEDGDRSWRRLSCRLERVE